MRLTPYRAVSAFAFLAIFLGIQEMSSGQTTTPPAPAASSTGITVYQYRRVPESKREEFIKRETTYWAEVARKALAKGNLTFWGLFEKVGGNDMENSSNFLFVNTYKNIDAAGDIWNPTAAFPNVPLAKMETGSLSTTTSMFFVSDQDFQAGAGVVPEKDFKYIDMVYHNSSNPQNLIALEKKHWAPFVKGAMDKKQTSTKGWGNAIVLSPSGPEVRFNTISFDIFSSLNDALVQWWDDKVVFPTDGLAEIEKIETGRSRVIYSVVKVVDNPPAAGK